MKKRILIVEDDAGFRGVFIRAMREALAPERLDAELVGEIHDGGVGSPIPTMVLTANLETSVAVRALEAGASGALSKLVSVPETVDALKRLTDAGHSEV